LKLEVLKSSFVIDPAFLRESNLSEGRACFEAGNYVRVEDVTHSPTPRVLRLELLPDLPVLLKAVVFVG
jgi:hypothetical protein